MSVGSSARGLLVRFAIDQAIRLAGAAVVLFWSAGTVSWWPAWGVVVLTAAWIVATAVASLRHSPDLLAERLAPGKGAKEWDKILMSAHALLQAAVYVVGGLDRRFGWTVGLPVAAQVAAAAVCALGYGLIVWATSANPFFSQIARIQAERGHMVATGGPYRWIRHPAYFGGVLLGASLGILLGSWWALAIGLADALLMVTRAALEDRMLQDELPGYSDYARRVPYRLLPGVW